MVTDATPSAEADVSFLRFSSPLNCFSNGIVMRFSTSDGATPS